MDGDIALDLDIKAEEVGVGMDTKKGGEKKKEAGVRWTGRVIGMGVFTKLSVDVMDEESVKLEGGEGNKRSEGYEEGGSYEVRGAERQTKINLRVAPVRMGLGGNGQYT